MKIPSRQPRSYHSKNLLAWRSLLIYTMRETLSNGAFKFRRKISFSRDASLRASKLLCLGRAEISRLIWQQFASASSIWTSGSAGNRNYMRWQRLISLKMGLSAKLSIFIGRLWVQRIASSSWHSKNGTTSLSQASGLFTWRIRWMNVSKSDQAKWERPATLCYL